MKEIKTVNKIKAINNTVNYIYLFLVLSVYPVVFHNYYFDITKTRSDFFTAVTAGYIAVGLVIFLFELFIKYRKKEKTFGISDSKEIRWTRPEMWMAFFMLSNFFAYMVTVTDGGFIDSKTAFYGSNGRLMGLLMYLILGAMFILLSRYADIKLPIYVLFGCVTLFSYLVAIYQHIDPDLTRFRSKKYHPKGFKALLEWFPHYAFNLKNRINKKQYNIFISTFGNINIFASFIVISLACFICMFIFSKKLYYKIFSGIIVTVGGTVMMIANSDSAYIGVGAVMFFMFLLAYKDGKLLNFFMSLILLGAGNLGIVLINKYISEVMKKKYDKRGGFAEHLDRLDYALAIMVILIVIYFIVFFVEKKFKDKLDKINKNKAVCILLGVVFVCMIVTIFVGNRLHIGAFTFNYRWGTFRGYIWSKSVAIFKDAPLRNKIFGYGNESIKALMNTYYHDEMLAVTKKVYDNAHNELLQYLVTTGICGVFAYLGLFVSSFVYILKNSKKEVIAYISLSVMLGYFVQGFINLNQPITTPFLFVFMAVGVGYVRSLKKKDNQND
ncbi:MAG: O-antigen ligase family protein [Lachnospiraceae bacterium]|nr:O-antigen ligase family protein [Lachnospiraceae bacterium]